MHIPKKDSQTMEHLTMYSYNCAFSTVFPFFTQLSLFSFFIFFFPLFIFFQFVLWCFVFFFSFSLSRVSMNTLLELTDIYDHESLVYLQIKNGWSFANACWCCLAEIQLVWKLSITICSINSRITSYYSRISWNQPKRF